MRNKFFGFTGLLLLIGFAIVYRPVASFQQSTATQSLANNVTVTATTISWEPSIAYQQAMITVVGDHNFTFSKIFSMAEPLTLDIQKGFPDGAYTFEWRLQPIVDQAILNELRSLDNVEARNARTAELQATGILPLLSSEHTSEYGYFTIASGLILFGTEEVLVRQAEVDTSAALAPQDQVINDDLIVNGSICAGFDCVNGESFGFDTLRLKENNLRIKFEDTSTSASFPGNDWQLTANDSSNGGANKFSIDDITGGRTPFTIEAAAPDNALYVENDGDVGFGTANPVVDVHIIDGNTPTVRLEQDGTNGFTAQTWDMAGNEANFFIRDATNGSTLPFKIKPGAPSNSIFVAADGDIGLGTDTPDTTLDIQDAGASIRVATSNNVADEIMTLDTGGNLTISGLLTEASDKNVKENFTTVDSMTILQQILQMPITIWNYIGDDNDTAHMGPMAQDFYAAFGLGIDDKHIAPLDANGVAFAGIQGLFDLFQVQDAELDDLQQENDDLKLRVDELELAVNALLEAQAAQGE
jgi:hypothetical protein